MVLDKKIHRAFRTHTTLYTKSIRDNFNFHHLPKIYIDLTWDFVAEDDTGNN